MSRKNRVGTCYTRAWVTSHSPMQAEGSSVVCGLLLRGWSWMEMPWGSWCIAAWNYHMLRCPIFTSICELWCAGPLVMCECDLHGPDECGRCDSCCWLLILPLQLSRLNSETHVTGQDISIQRPDHPLLVDPKMAFYKEDLHVRSQ